MAPIVEAADRCKPAAHMLAEQAYSVALDHIHGLRIGSSRVLARNELPPALQRWVAKVSGGVALLRADSFAVGCWQDSLCDDAFPQRFLAIGGHLDLNPVKVLFLNSFDPQLEFVYPYPPTEQLAATLLRESGRADARVYDPNLESRDRIRDFPSSRLELYNVLESESFDLIVQAVYNVDYDLRLICEVRQRCPDAIIILGGPHLRLVDLGNYLVALPIDGLILGDGRSSLLQLVDQFPHPKPNDIPGILTNKSAARLTTAPSLAAARPMAITSRRGENAITPRPPDIWKLDTYAERNPVTSCSKPSTLPYDMIGLRPLTVLTSQRCGKACYWCRSPKTVSPRDPNTIVEEIERGYEDCDSLHFDDNEIWFDPHNFERIGKSLVDRGLNRKPMLVKTTADQVTRERAEFMCDIGVRIVAIGIESFDQRSLDLLHKGTTVEDNHRALNLVLDAGMKPGINAIWLVPGIDLPATRKLVLETMPYLLRGAYLNLVPELSMGNVRSNGHITQLTKNGYFRNASRYFCGMRQALDYLVVNLTPEMSQFKETVLARANRYKRRLTPNSASVAIQSLCLIGFIAFSFPKNSNLGEKERNGVLADVSQLLIKVQQAEQRCILTYEPPTHESRTLKW